MRTTAFIAAAFLLAATSFTTAAQTTADDIQLQQLITRFTADEESLDRVYIFKHSPEYFDRFGRFYDDFLQTLKAVPFNRLSVSGQVDYVLLKRNIVHEREQLQQAMQTYKGIEGQVDFAPAIRSLQQQRRRGKKLDGAAVADTLNAVCNGIRRAWHTLDNARYTTEQSRMLAETVQELSKGLQQTWQFYAGYDPQFTWWVDAPYHATDSLLRNFSEAVAKKRPVAVAATDASGIKGQPIGAEQLQQLLQYEMIPYTADQLVELANKEFAWCDAEMLKASRGMGFGDDWKKALEKVKQHYVAPGEQPELINRLAEEAIRYVEKNNLVTVPELAKESWRMNMLTVEQQRFAPFFLGGESILIAYPTDEMDSETKQMSLRSNNYGFAHATVFHELIPGHNLQGFMNRRYKQYRGLFRTPFSVEGWALYWEMLLWDKGFHATPEEKVGALFWRMHRCARILFSLNYHLGKWKPQQCIDFLVSRVGHERFSATSEVRRSFEGNYGPLYQVAYMMGGLQLRALHKEVVDGGKLTEKQFHDAFLKENAIPVEMFRAIIKGQQLTPDYTTGWFFFGKEIKDNK
jgi:uncharacterized protein (DUF885 family)